MGSLLKIARSLLLSSSAFERSGTRSAARGQDQQQVLAHRPRPPAPRAEGAVAQEALLRDPLRQAVQGPT